MNCSACCSSDLGLGGQGNPDMTVNLSRPTHHPRDSAESACFLITVGLVMRLWLWRGERLPLLGRCPHPFWQATRHRGWAVKGMWHWRSSVHSCINERIYYGALVLCHNEMRSSKKCFWFIQTHKNQNASCSFQNSPRMKVCYLFQRYCHFSSHIWTSFWRIVRKNQHSLLIKNNK